jgi:hypothetical protein
MSSVYGRLGFNYNDPTTDSTVENYTGNVINGMNLVPTLLNAWQTQDVATSNTGGYFVNPVANVTQIIWNTSNSIFQLTNGLTGSTGAITTNIQNARIDANTVSFSAANSYLYITDRQSNVVPADTDTSTPHYKTATGVGKMLSYITFQTDGVQNNSPIMGNFTSITLGNTLNSLSNTLVNVTGILANSITVVPDGLGGYANTSNISLANSELLYNTIHQISNTIVYYPEQDKQFFMNSQNVVSDYSNVSSFSQIGATESYLLNTFIGTDKIKSRINS